MSQKASGRGYGIGKTPVIGMSPKHLARYVTEITGRQNVRDLDTIDQMSIMARNMIGQRLEYQNLIQ